MQSSIGPTSEKTPFAARLHFIPRALRRPHAVLIRSLRGYFSCAPGWVLLTTRGRHTGLPREVLLPCARFGNQIVVISTYGWRSDWIRNIRKNPEVKVTVGGKIVAGLAQAIEDLAQKQAIVSEHPFVPVAPFCAVHSLALTLLGPLTVAFLRRWVAARPVVLITTS